MTFGYFIGIYRYGFFYGRRHNNTAWKRTIWFNPIKMKFRTPLIIQRDVAASHKRMKELGLV